jgi:hypothetical protein
VSIGSRLPRPVDLSVVLDWVDWVSWCRIGADWLTPPMLCAHVFNWCRCCDVFWTGADHLTPPMPCWRTSPLFWTGVDWVSWCWIGADKLTPPMFCSHVLDWCRCCDVFWTGANHLTPPMPCWHTSPLLWTGVDWVSWCWIGADSPRLPCFAPMF